MPKAIVTGSGGLIGSESVKHFVELGYDVIGLENDMRSRFFGPEASTSPTTKRLIDACRRSRRWRSTSVTPTRSRRSCATTRRTLRS